MGKINSDKNKHDGSEREMMILAAYEASSKAVRESQALGLVITIIEDNYIVDVYPDGRKVKKEVISKPSARLKALRHLEKGEKLVLKQ
jgi:hypothetical protein